MQYVEAPTRVRRYAQPAIFLAGGISNCSDWQSRMREMLEPRVKVPATLFNPRRARYPTDPSALRQQIEWEFAHLWRAQIVTFWFSRATLCPITLYELGSHLTRLKMLRAGDRRRPRICIGVERGYQRAQDVAIQRSLLAPEVPIVDSIRRLAEFVVREVTEFNQRHTARSA